MNALTSAINDANITYNDVNATQEQVNAANSALTSAKDTFIGNIKDGLKPDSVPDPVTPGDSGE